MQTKRKRTQHTRAVKATVLDSRHDVEGRCYLCKIRLEDYILGLPPTYREYDIQREIVSNVYLDHLVDTVLASRHIPPIVLVASDADFRLQGSDAVITSFKILDGLQRTFRLEAIRKTIKYSIEKLADSADCLSWNKFKFSRQFSSALREINSNTDVLRAVLNAKQERGPDRLLDCFRSNQQWYEIWTGLTPEAEVRKMLVLNAGHKPVKTRHQLELLFLNLLPILRAGEAASFQLVREKDITAFRFSKKRKCGTFHFAHIITSLLSFYEGRPVAPTTDLIQSIQSSDGGIEEYSEFTSPSFLREFVAFLVKLDKLIAEQYPESGTLWMGREVSLAGLFGALGAYTAKLETTRQSAMAHFITIAKSHPKALALDQFETKRNTLDLSKVNFGKVNRDAAYSGVLELLHAKHPRAIDWAKHFGVEAQ